MPGRAAQERMAQHAVVALQDVSPSQHLPLLHDFSNRRKAEKTPDSSSQL
jgi:hypothetical protein